MQYVLHQKNALIAEVQSNSPYTPVSEESKQMHPSGHVAGFELCPAVSFAFFACKTHGERACEKACCRCRIHCMRGCFQASLHSRCSSCCPLFSSPHAAPHRRISHKVQGHRPACVFSMRAPSPKKKSMSSWYEALDGRNCVL